MTVPRHVLFDRELPRGWTVTTVDAIKAADKSACVAGPFGSDISSKYFTPEGVPVIRGSNLTDDLTRFVPKNFVFVSPERAASYRPQHVRAGDLVFTCWGTIGQVGLIPANGPFPVYIISNKQLKLRPNRALADPVYLFYYFASPQMVGHVRNRAIGAAVPGINLGILKALEVVLPPLTEQRRIASILADYDDLIENNTRRIAILEEMARRIYEEWFVRFRFPGYEGVRMVESKLGLVPEGWSVQGLYDVADLTYGFPFKSNLFREGGEGLGVIRIRDIRDDYTATRTTEDVDLKYRVADGDILVGMDGAFHMGRWAGGVAWLNQRVVRIRPKAGIPRSWLFWVTREPIKTLEATIVGTTVAHLSARDLKGMQVLVPPTAVLEAVGNVLEPMSDLELTLKKKNANLRATRDLLLPKLISGELDVSAMPESEAIAA